MNNKIKEFYGDYPFPNDKIIHNSNWILNSLDHPIKPGSSILDIGCGTGEMSCFLSQYGKVVGTDFSMLSISKAIDLTDELKIKNVYFAEDDITKEKERSKFDYIFCIGVLHHIPELDKAIENIKKCMHKDSYLIISVYNKYGKFLWKRNHKKIENISRMKDTFEHPYEVYYSRKEFENILKEHNFKIVGMWRNIPDWVRLITGRGDLMSFCVRLNE